MLGLNIVCKKEMPWLKGVRWYARVAYHVLLLVDEILVVINAVVVILSLGFIYTDWQTGINGRELMTWIRKNEINSN